MTVTGRFLLARRNLFGRRGAFPSIATSTRATTTTTARRTARDSASEV
jgi:hypothetical protein